MVVGLVWVLALVTSFVILFQAVRSVWWSGRSCLSAVGRLGDAASTVGQTVSDLLDTTDSHLVANSPHPRASRRVSA